MVLTQKGDFFYDSWDVGVEEKNHEYIASHIIKYIKEIGPEHVIQIITDGAYSNKKAAIECICVQYPRLTWTWCTAHVLDLLLEDWCKGQNNWMARIFSDVKSIVKMIRASQFCQAVYRKHSKNLEILLPCATRFATHFIMTERAYKVQGALKAMVIDPTWTHWKDNKLPKDVTASRPKIFTRIKAQIIMRRILHDNFWKKVDLVLKICTPVVEMLRQFDSSSPQAGFLYWRLEETLDDLKLKLARIPSTVIPASQSQKMIESYEKRQTEAMTNDMMLTAALVNPQFLWDNTKAPFGREVLRNGFERYVKQWTQGDEMKARAIHIELIEAKNLDGLVGSNFARDTRTTIEPCLWWDSWGSSSPNLREMAMKILSQKTCASACERNWSTYSFIHSKSRNRLTVDRARDLVYVFSNERIESKMTNIQNKVSNIYHRFAERGAPGDAQNTNEDDGLPTFDPSHPDYWDEDRVDEADLNLYGNECDKEGREAFGDDFSHINRGDALPLDSQADFNEINDDDLEDPREERFEHDGFWDSEPEYDDLREDVLEDEENPPNEDHTTNLALIEPSDHHLSIDSNTRASFKAPPTLRLEGEDMWAHATTSATHNARKGGSHTNPRISDTRYVSSPRRIDTKVKEPPRSRSTHDERIPYDDETLSRPLKKSRMMSVEQLSSQPTLQISESSKSKKRRRPNKIKDKAIGGDNEVKDIASKEDQSLSTPDTSEKDEGEGTSTDNENDGLARDTDSRRVSSRAHTVVNYKEQLM